MKARALSFFVLALLPFSSFAADNGGDWAGGDATGQLTSRIRALGKPPPAPPPSALPEPAVDTPPDPLSGMMGGPDCSGVVVRFSNDPYAHAIVLSAGHCYRLPMPKNTFAAGETLSKSLVVIARHGSVLSLHATKLLYATMTGTDVELLELGETYADLAQLSVDSYEISREPAKAGDKIFRVSGRKETVQSCSIGEVVHRLTTSVTEENDAYRMSADCPATAPGWSGAPLISAATGKIVGLHSTTNDSGRCTDDDPCEVADDGTVSIHKDAQYGQKVHEIMTCVDSAGRFNLSLASCALYHR
jgi:hypothetical protein